MTDIKATPYNVDALPDLVEALKYLIEMTEPPERNCSCHISPPCGWCTEYGGAEDAHAVARAALSKAGALSALAEVE